MEEGHIQADPKTGKTLFEYRIGVREPEKKKTAPGAPKPAAAASEKEE
jgi:hypothetical protein